MMSANKNSPDFTSELLIPDAIITFEDRIFPCFLTRNDTNKKVLMLPQGWTDISKNFDSFDAFEGNSLALRTGAPFNTVIDQLKSTPSCPSYAIRSAVKHDTSKGNACPTALGNVLYEMQQEIYEELGVVEEEVYTSTVKISTDDIIKRNYK